MPGGGEVGERGEILYNASGILKIKYYKEKIKCCNTDQSTYLEITL